MLILGYLIRLELLGYLIRLELFAAFGPSPAPPRSGLSQTSESGLPQMVKSGSTVSQRPQIGVPPRSGSNGPSAVPGVGLSGTPDSGFDRLPSRASRDLRIGVQRSFQDPTIGVQRSPRLRIDPGPAALQGPTNPGPTVPPFGPRRSSSDPGSNDLPRGSRIGVRRPLRRSRTRGQHPLRLPGFGAFCSASGSLRSPDKSSSYHSHTVGFRIFPSENPVRSQNRESTFNSVKSLGIRGLGRRFRPRSLEIFAQRRGICAISSSIRDENGGPEHGALGYTRTRYPSFIGANHGR